MDPNIQRGNTHAKKTGGRSRKKRNRGKQAKQTQAVVTNGPTILQNNNVSEPVEIAPKGKAASTKSVQNGHQHPPGLRGKDIGMYYANKKKQRQNEVESLKDQLKELPTLPREDYEALNSLIDQITTDHCLTEEDVNIRLETVEHVREVLTKEYKGLEVKLYGSSMTEFGLRSSDLNIDLEVPDSAASFNIKDVVETLVAAGYTEVESKSSMAFECVSLHSPLRKLVCRISVGARCPEYTSHYIKLYSTLDPRLKKLAITLRHWAQVCRLFEPDSITFPPHCLDLMVIYFLQRVTPPVLPVLWQDGHCSDFELVKRLETNVKAKPYRTENTTETGQLWLEMIHFYSAVCDLEQFVICVHDKQTVTLKKHEWTTVMAVEDPFHQHTNLIQNSHKRIVVYLKNCLMKSCCYFANLSLPSSPPSKSKDVLASKNGAKPKCTEAPQGNGAKPKSTDAQQGNGAKTKCTDAQQGNGAKPKSTDAQQGNGAKTKCTDAQQGNGAKPKSTDAQQENGAKPKSTDAQQENGAKTKCTDAQQGNGAKPKSTDAQQENGAKPKCTDAQQENGAKPKCTDAQQENGAKPKCTDAQQENGAKPKCTDAQQENGAKPKSTDAQQENGAKPKCTDTQQEGACSSSCDKCSTSVCDKDSCDLKPTADSACDSDGRTEDSTCDSDGRTTDSTCDSDGGTEGQEKGSTQDEIQQKERPEFKFERTYLADAMGPPKVCSRCERMGHTQSNCPVPKLTIEPLPDMDPAFLHLLTPVIQNIPSDFALTKDEEKGRDLVRKHTEMLIRQLDPGITVELFGSSKNGFGFHHSDIDMCAVVSSQCQMTEKKLFRSMTAKLWQNQHMYSDIVHIKWARIPLLKFVHKLTGLGCDLSINNMLALHNTRLIETYSKIDPRVKMLGYAIKVFAKVCGIGDAAQGTLSSYTYTVMILHYLQHTQPPVLPVLQQLPHAKMTEEGRDVGFFSNLQQLPRVWPGYHKNRQCVGELWLGFFRYYLEEFDLDTQVVSIRQWEPISKAEKSWHELCMAVEDPFIHDRNLSKRSFTIDRYIREVLIQGRHLYGTPVASIPPHYNTAADYFFDAEFLTKQSQTKGKQKKKKEGSTDKKNAGEQSKNGKDVKEQITKKALETLHWK